MQKFGLMRLPVVNGNYTQVDIPAFQKMADAFIAADGMDLYEIRPRFSLPAAKESAGAGNKCIISKPPV